MLTKNMIYNGQVIPVKQCMPEGMDIEVEEVDLDNQSADEPMRTKRFLFNVRILITFIFALRDQDSRKREGGGGGRERSLRGGSEMSLLKMRCNFYKNAPRLHKSLNHQHRLSTHPFLGHDTAVPKILRISVRDLKILYKNGPYSKGYFRLRYSSFPQFDTRNLIFFPTSISRFPLMFLWRSNWDCEGCPREAKFLRPKQIFIHAMLLFYSVAAPRLNVRTTTAVPLANVVLRNLGSSSLAILWLVTIFSI